jgi:inorganic pyrophosphatase
VDVEVIIEVPQGSRNKYEMDDSGRIRLDRMLFTSTRYPADYGFILGTLAEDGDPLDALVLLGEPAFPGSYVIARSVGLFWMRDEHGPDAKILTVPAHDPRYENMRDLPDIPAHLLAEISHFFDVYKELEPGKGTRRAGLAGPGRGGAGNHRRFRAETWFGLNRAATAPAPSASPVGRSRPGVIVQRRRRC